MEFLQKKTQVDGRSRIAQCKGAVHHVPFSFQGWVIVVKENSL